MSDPYLLLGNSTRERVGELLIDLDASIEGRRSTDELTWTREVLALLATAHRDILNYVGDSGLDKRIKIKE